MKLSSIKLTLNQISLKIAISIREHINNKCFSVANYHTMCKRHNTKLGVSLGFVGNNNSSKSSEFIRYKSMRALSTMESYANPTTITRSIVANDNREFMAIFPDIVRDITDSGKHTDIPTVTKRLAEVLQYNVSTGETISGLSVVMAYKMLEKPENLTSKNIKLANILGWCTELVLVCGEVIDDIIDNSEIRHGNPCWYKNPEIGLHAVYDAILINYGVYELLQKYFSSLPCYVPILELFHDTIFNSVMGQVLDILLMENNKPRLNMFTMDQYLTIIRYKIVYCASHLPVASAMYLANILDEELHRQCKTILMEMGKYFQIKNDFDDCFGNREITGKIGTDIKNGKCSWLAVVALERATSTQRAIMEKHYGNPEEESIKAIHNLYEELNLPHVYAKYEEESFNLICNHIQQNLSKELPHDLMFKLLSHIYKREC